MDLNHIHVSDLDIGWQGLHAFLPFLLTGLTLLVVGLTLQKNYLTIPAAILLIIAAVKLKKPLKFKAKRQE